MTDFSRKTLTQSAPLSYFSPCQSVLPIKKSFLTIPPSALEKGEEGLLSGMNADENGKKRRRRGREAFLNSRSRNHSGSFRISRVPLSFPFSSFRFTLCSEKSCWTNASRRVPIFRQTYREKKRKRKLPNKDDDDVRRKKDIFLLHF